MHISIKSSDCFPCCNLIISIIISKKYNKNDTSNDSLLLSNVSLYSDNVILKFSCKILTYDSSFTIIVDKIICFISFLISSNLL